MQTRISSLLFVLTVFSFCEDKTVFGEVHIPEKYYENYTCLENKKGVDYRGTVSHTVNTIEKEDVIVSTSGKPCIPWDKYDEKGYHTYNQEAFPKSGLDGTACRNPGGTGKTVWCYTANYKAKRNGSTYWGYCKVPLCSQKLSDKIVLGKVQGYHIPEKYYENYVCLKNKKGVDYRGGGTGGRTVNTIKKGDVVVSTNGKPCIPWDKYSDKKKFHYHNQEDYPNAGLDGGECRNPGGHEKTVWCYIDTFKAREEGKPYWGYCKVPLCRPELSGVNIAEGKKAWQSSTFQKHQAHLATNGIMSSIMKSGEQWTCAHTRDDKLSWIMIDLEAYFGIQKVVVLNRKCDDAKHCAGRLGYFKVSVGKAMFLGTEQADFIDLVPNYYTLCKFVDAEVDNGAEEVITCKMHGGRYPVGRYVVLAENHGNMTICQIQVFGKFAGFNIGMGKFAYQAMTYRQQEASLATNYFISSKFEWTEPKRCAVSTAVNNINWLVVSLQDFERFPYIRRWVVNYIIEDVFLLNIGDRRTGTCNDGSVCKGHLQSFEVSVGVDFFKNRIVERIFGEGLIPSQFTHCTKPNSDLQVGPGQDEIVHCNGAEGRYVVVATRREYLTICHIHILGVRK